MKNGKVIDFMRNPSGDRLRKEAQNICASYSHPWDFMAELCQNSVDAINRYNQVYGETNAKKHKIEITINCKERSLKILDTGLGFPHDKFGELLAPHGTDKTGLTDIIGEKGIGLKYTIFISNNYSIKTTSCKAHIEGYIKNATEWKNGHIDEPPQFAITAWEETNYAPQETSTEIFLSDVEKVYDEQDDIFCQSLNVLEYLLRTQTAIGYLKQIFDKRDFNTLVKLKLVDFQGRLHELEISPTYMLPDQFIDKTVILNLDDFVLKAAAMSDTQKAKKLKGKSLLKVGSVNRAGRKINFYFWK